MSDLFEDYNDLEDIEQRLRSGDAGEKRVAIMELADLGDPAAIPLLASMRLGRSASTTALPLRLRWCVRSSTRQSRWRWLRPTAWRN